MVGNGRVKAAGAFVVAGRCELRGGIAGYPGGEQNAWLLEVVRSGTMENATVVPDQQVARHPVMGIQARRLAGGRQQIIEQRLCGGIIHARYSIGVPPYAESFALRYRMNLDQWTQRCALSW